MRGPIDERRITRHKIAVKPDSHSYQPYDVADDEGLLHASLSLHLSGFRNLTGLCESTHEFVTGTGGVNAVLRTFNILTTTGG
jgi:hypothetical protein